MPGSPKLSMPTSSRINEGGERDDDTLVSQAAAGHQSAFSHLVERHSPMILRFLTRLVGNEDDAQDAAQETFVALYRNLDRFDPSRPFTAWLFHIARNKGRDVLRKRTALRWLGGDEMLENHAALAPLPDTEVSDRQALEQLEMSIATLPEGLKTPLLLSAIEGLSHSEIGSVMGLSTKAVEVRIYRARFRLRENDAAKDEG